MPAVRIALVFFLLTVGRSGSALDILAEVGPTRPLPRTGAVAEPDTAPSAPIPFNLATLFPIRSPSWQIGAAAPLSASARARLRSLSRPLFLIGTDPQSLTWLDQHRTDLIRHGALGFVIEAEQLADFQQAQAIAGPDLLLLPSSAEQLAPVLGLTAYPVLITGDGLQP